MQSGKARGGGGEPGGSCPPTERAQGAKLGAWGRCRGGEQGGRESEGHLGGGEGERVL